MRRSNPVSADALSLEAAAPAAGGSSTVPTSVRHFALTRVAAAAAPAPTTVQGSADANAMGSSYVALAQRRYHTRVGPTPPDPSHRRPARRAPPSKRARTSGPGESPTSRPRAPPSRPYQGIDGALDLSPASIIRRPYFHCSPIPGNADCSERDLHGEVYYNLLAFAEDPELRDSILLVQRYHLEPFMTQCRYFYPRVVIEFYHTMTSRREANPTALHFSIDDRLGILRASDITAALHLLVVLANAADYRQWPHLSTREMVRLLSMDATAGTVLFRRQLPQRMLLIDHILRSNLFPLQHIVQRRGAILEALYRISKGFWFSPAELVMMALFHFEDRVHRRSLPRAESTPFLFLRLLCQVLEHFGFPIEPRLERFRGCEATLTVDRWQAMPRAFHLPPPGPVEDQPIADTPLEDLPLVAEHTEEPPTPASSVPASVPPTPSTTALVPLASVPSIPSEPSAPMPTSHSDIAGPSTSAPPQQYITISTGTF